MRLNPLIFLTVGLAALVLAVGAGADSTDRTGGASARAFGIRVIVPGQPGAATPTLSAPQDAVEFGGAFAYPTGGTAVTASSVTASVTATSGTTATAAGSSTVTGLSLFGGEVTAASVTAESHAKADPDTAAGDFGASAISSLVVLGQPVTPVVNQQVPLADWGTLTPLVETGARADGTTPGYHDFVTALDIRLTADHDGLPAGTEIQVGYAEATAQASQQAPLPKPPSTPTATTGNGTTTGKAPGTTPPESNGLPPVHPPPNVTPKLTAGGYVFPVYGTTAFTDTFGAFRGDVSGDWHHGDDIFANLGAPILAVARGTVFSVGWNDVGGYRLWLRDDQGNEFYYAHLSAYSPLAVNGARVNAGDVLGFVGNTGDAQGTPYHVHFEVHPVGLLGLGYDGAVDPTSYLLAWEHLKDVRFDAVAGWAPAPLSSANAPKPGAILLQSTDISSASGLDPASLERAVAPLQEGEGGLLTRRQQPPAPELPVRQVSGSGG